MKKAAVVFGRFQPPHKGHSKLIEEAFIQKRKKKLDDVFVVIIEGKNSSKDKKRNPLTGKQREKYLKASKYAKGVNIIIASNIVDGFGQLIDKGYSPRVIVGGQDAYGGESTACAYQDIVKKYFPGHTTTSISVIRKLDKETIKNDFDISGSYVRTAVEDDHFDLFKKWIDIEEELIVRQLWKDLQKAIGNK